MDAVELGVSSILDKEDVHRAVSLIVDGVRAFNDSHLLRYSKIKSVSSRHSKFVTMRCDGRLVGFLMYRVEKQLCLIYEIHVDADYRSRGLGKRLIEHLCGIMRNRLLVLFVHTRNSRAMKFYKANGFVRDKQYVSAMYHRMVRFN
ncbi:hypothetical protein PAPHI01_1757 [Pancytospora philotis]|nr:hypothetical protein PAPHI01_1757 [Pancytospora philotis]